MLTQDRAVILEALKGSPIVEMGTNGSMLRPREAWASWVLPVEQRDHTAHAPAPVAGGSPIPGSWQHASAVPPTTAAVPSASGDAKAVSDPAEVAPQRAAPAAAPAAAAEPPATPAKDAAAPAPAKEVRAPEQRRRDGGGGGDDDDMFQLDEVEPLNPSLYIHPKPKTPKPGSVQLCVPCGTPCEVMWDLLIRSQQPQSKASKGRQVCIQSAPHRETTLGRASIQLSHRY